MGVSCYLVYWPAYPQSPWPPSAPVVPQISAQGAAGQTQTGNKTSGKEWKGQGTIKVEREIIWFNKIYTLSFFLQAQDYFTLFQTPEKFEAF